MRQAVSSAEFAVLAAEQAGAPVAELDALCRRLRLAAEDADRHVPSPWKVPLPRQAPPGISDLLIAAEMIQGAAATVITSLSDADELSDPADASRAEGIRRDCEAAAARIESAARATPASAIAGHRQLDLSRLMMSRHALPLGSDDHPSMCSPSSQSAPAAPEPESGSAPVRHRSPNDPEDRITPTQAPAGPPACGCS